MYGVVIDNTGRVVWYHRFVNGPGLSFMAQPMGRYLARPPTPAVGDMEPWVELDPLGNVTRTMGCARGLQPPLRVSSRCVRRRLVRGLRSTCSIL